MPQGRKKVPFSGKAKKEQLKAKKHLKNTASCSGHRTILMQTSDDEEKISVRKLNEQPSKGSMRSNANRYALKFCNDTPEELRLKREEARQEIVRVPEEKFEICADEYFLKELDFPVRPKWSYDMSRDVLEARENKYFTEYIKNIEKLDWKTLSYFELNLETWRQLWRVLEMSDIVLFIVDIRFPVLMFPPSLYEHVTKVLHKDMILVLNKIDLAPAPLVVAWLHYFKSTYPNLHVVMFTTLPEYNLRGNQTEKSGFQIRRRKGRLRMAAEGTQLLFDACSKIVNGEVDLSSWQAKIKDEMACEYDTDVEVGETVSIDKVDTGYFEHERYKNGVLTVGCVGQPNVGKSSLMNAIMGKKVVSVSKTPGHTKHFQTIFLTQNVRLCDCPGLVFPSRVPKSLQVLMGSFPVAQLREPYSTVRFLAERVDLVSLLKIAHPAGDASWSPVDVCDGWAQKRGFLTAKAARLDTYRAANNILRMALDGKICLCLYPKGYVSQRAAWLAHADVQTVLWVQARAGQAAAVARPTPDSSDDDDISDSVRESGESDGDQETDSSAELRAQTNKFSLLRTD